MERIYHTWDKWECYKAGFFEVHPPKGLTDDDCVNMYATLLKDIIEFKKVMLSILNDWPNSCEHNLTNDRMNRIAWMGQSALCYKYGIPSKYRGGYNLLSEQEQYNADQAALECINIWMDKMGYPHYNHETIKSKTEANLY